MTKRKPPIKEPRWTSHDELCVSEYMANGGNKTDAFKTAYAKKVARWKNTTIQQKAWEFFEREDVKARQAEVLAAAQAHTQITANYVLEQAVKLHERCMQEIEPFTDKKGEQIYDDQGRPIYKFDPSGAAKALEIIGKHEQIQAFKERKVVEQNVTITTRAVSAVDAILDEALGRGQGISDAAARPH